MSTTPNADVQQFADEVDFRVSERGVRRMRAEFGEQGARDRIAAGAALVALSSALGAPLTPLAALRRLDAAGGKYNVAAARLVGAHETSVSRLYEIEWNRLERQLYANDARARHAPVLGAAGGQLGWQSEILLACAADVGLTDPDADAYRRRLRNLVDIEIERRYPIRDVGVRVDIAGEPPSRHSTLVDRAEHDDRDARRLALARRPALGQVIDACADSPRARGGIVKVLNEIRVRLGQRALEENWRPDPQRYRREVIEKAATAA